MSTDFKTQKEALAKVSSSGGTNEFATKQWLTSQNKFDDSKYSSYKTNQYVIDDHIIKKQVVEPEPPTAQKVLCTLKFIDGRTGYIADSTQVSAFYLQVGLIEEGSFESVSTGDIFPCNHQHTFVAMQGTKFQFSLGSNTSYQPPSVLQTLVNSNRMENTYEIVIPYENSVTIEVELDLT